MRTPFERRLIFSAKPLSNSAVNTFRTELPVTGENLERIRLILNLTIIHGTGSGPVVTGAFDYIKAITLKTSKGDLLVDGVCGKAFYYYNLKNELVTPYYDDIAAASATYKAVIDIPFHRNNLIRPEDLYYLTNYGSLELSVTTGSIADLLGTPGTDTVSATLDIIYHLTKSPLSKSEKSFPLALPYYKQLATIPLASLPYFQLESANDLALSEFLILATTSNSAPFRGTAADNITTLSMKDNVQYFIQQVPVADFVQERKRYFLSNPTGIYYHSFIKTGSIKESYPTGGKSDIKITADTFTGTTYADCLLVGFRSFRI